MGDGEVAGIGLNVTELLQSLKSDVNKLLRRLELRGVEGMKDFLPPKLLRSFASRLSLCIEREIPVPFPGGLQFGM